jgi:hypothetical protein
LNNYHGAEDLISGGREELSLLKIQSLEKWKRHMLDKKNVHIDIFIKE